MHIYIRTAGKTWWKMKLRSLRNKWTCERSTADEQIGQVCQSLLRRADSCSGDNHHTILPSVSRTIDPKDRQTQAWIQPLTSSFAPLLWLSCTHLHPHSNAPADGMTQTRGSRELHNWAGPKSCSQFDEVRVTKTCTDLVDLKPAGPQGPASRTFPHCDFRGGVGKHVQVRWMVLHLKCFTFLSIWNN